MPSLRFVARGRSLEVRCQRSGPRVDPLPAISQHRRWRHKLIRRPFELRDSTSIRVVPPRRDAITVVLARRGPGGLDASARADRAIRLCGPAVGDGVVTHSDIAWVAASLGVQDCRWCHGTVDGFSV